MSYLKRVAVFFAFVLCAVAGQSASAAEPQRLALVIGQGAYESGKLPTSVNDAGLVAQALTSAGFEVVQGADLNASDLRRAVRDFLDKAQDLEPSATVMVYLSGHGVQLEGDNYLIPVDARIQRDADVPIEGFRVSDLVRSLDQIPAQTRIVVADMARDYPLASTGAPIAKGLALMDPPAGFLIAFSSAPGITAADGQGPYGAYATALVEMMRQPGLPLDEVFARVRLRTHETTNGLQTPWHAAKLDNVPPFVFFEQAEPAAAPPVQQVRRIEEVSPEEAYGIAVERDTIQDYQSFLRRYPDHPLARRVTALLAARREALVWRRTIARNTSEAYWTYLRTYPNGPHAGDSRRRLARLSAPFTPPPVFQEVVYEDLPPPLPVVERIEVVEVVTIIREAPPPPPPPVYLLPPRDYRDEVIVTIFREPPPPPPMRGILPIPVAFPVPYRARPPVVFYQPIAPVTPRGAVIIPVRPPVISGPQGQRLPMAPRPRQPGIAYQPGLAAPIEPIPAVNPMYRPPRTPGAHPGQMVPQRPARLPTRPIVLPGQPPAQATDQPSQQGSDRGGAPFIQPTRVPSAQRPVAPNGNTGIVPPHLGRPPVMQRPARDERPEKDRPRPDQPRADRPGIGRPGEDGRPPVVRPNRPEIGQPVRPRPGDGDEIAPRQPRPTPRQMPVVREERPTPRVNPMERPMERPRAPAMERPRPVPQMDAPQRVTRPMPTPAMQPRPVAPAFQPQRHVPDVGARPGGQQRGCVPAPGRPCVPQQSDNRIR